MNNLVKKNSTELVSQGQQYSKLMELAITQNADVDKLEKLMDLQERWEAKEAKKAHTKALSMFKSKCPIIEKTKKAYNYSYAPLPSIDEQIKGILQECGLSFRFEQSHKGGEIQVACVVTHVDGHSERTMMSAEADNTGSKNAVQAIGSTNTYLQRYTLIGALGITTADEDDDAARASEININDLLDLYKLVRDKFDTVCAVKEGIANDDFETAGAYWQDLTRVEKTMLFRAPTKGGIFTTEERNLMSGDKREFFSSPISVSEFERERDLK